jgi:hypothetical protein
VSVFRCWIDGETLSLKGQSHEIFVPLFFFQQSTPPRALIHGLRPFLIWPRIRRENRPFPRGQFRVRSIFLKANIQHTISIHSTKKSWGILDFIFSFIGFIDLAETDFDDFPSDYLVEYEAICETALACESGF